MKLIWILLIPLAISAKYVDSDLDGVEDSKDLCPNTYIFDLVDKNGCSKKRLIPKDDKPRYSISLSYYNSKDIVTQKSYSLNFSANFKNYTIYLDTSTYNIENENGFDDTTIAIFYNYSKFFDYTLGLGVYLPTNNNYKDNKTDYFLKFKIAYKYKKYDSYISYQKSINRDKDTKNTNSYSFGLGYNLNKNLYTSISYIQSDSLYINNQRNRYLSLFANYYINNATYISINYTKGLNSNSINSSSYFTIGYNF